MASITVMQDILGVHLLSSSGFEGLLTLTATTITDTQLSLASDQQTFTFYGSGFDYQMNGGEIVGLIGGTVTRIAITDAEGTTVYLDWSGLNLSAAAFSDYLTTSNWGALNALLFNTSDTYSLSAGRDAVRGFGGDDLMRGFAGADRLIGDAGADTLLGGIGADRLTGGAGVDNLTGGAGSDAFIFTHRGAANREIITDFNATDDALRFDTATFTGFSYTGQLNGIEFVAGAVALDPDDRFLYRRVTGNLWYDADGSGDGAKVLVAELTDGTALSAADIFLY